MYGMIRQETSGSTTGGGRYRTRKSGLFDAVQEFHGTRFCGELTLQTLYSMLTGDFHEFLCGAASTEQLFHVIIHRLSTATNHIQKVLSLPVDH